MTSVVSEPAFTVRGYQVAARRRRAKSMTSTPIPPGIPASRRDELAESLAAAEEIAEILAAQAGDEVAYHRHQASQIVGFMLNSGWTITRR